MEMFSQFYGWYEPANESTVGIGVLAALVGVVALIAIGGYLLICAIGAFCRMMGRDNVSRTDED
jgi:hypothetical protein